MLAVGYGRIINTASMASLLVPHPQKQVRVSTALTPTVVFSNGKSA